ncbi:MAG TPA: ribonuclease R, partial [Cellvibrionales bacterium]|nr:ribonuclease R [Cellvibrionales bacterium]
RRYPDLLVHRAIRSIVRSRKICDQVKRVPGAKVISKKIIYPYSQADIVAAGMHTSMAERRADDATRDVTAWLKCEYLQDRIGETFDGVVAGVTRFGIFVELENLFVEGLVHINSLGQDFFRFDQAQQRLVGERTGVVYCLGDKVKVVVARVDLDERKVDLEMHGAVKPGDDKKRFKDKKAKDRKEASARSLKAGAGGKGKSGVKDKSSGKNKPSKKAAAKKKGGKKAKPKSASAASKKPSATKKTSKSKAARKLK